MKDQDQNPQAAAQVNETMDLTSVTAAKRAFIEPEISQPVDVLEATTFFQSVDSGATN